MTPYNPLPGILATAFPTLAGAKPGRPCPMTGCPNRILDTGLHCGDHPSRREPPCEHCGVHGIEPFSWPERPCSECHGTGECAPRDETKGET